VNDGCTPTKTMITSGRVAYLARRGADYGINIGSNKVTTDMTKVRQRKRDIVDSFRGGSERRVKDNGIDLFMGEGQFTSDKNITVTLNEGGEKKLRSDLIFINVGERPSVPNVDGLDEVRKTSPSRILDSTSIQELDQVPSSLVVIGGGYIGLEFGQLFQRLGAQVTVVQRGDRLLPREDPEVTQVLEDILKEDGMTIHLLSGLTGISSANDNLSLKIQSKDGNESSITASHVLFASGRRPNTDRINISNTSIEVDRRGYIKTNDQLQTNVEGVYALGDVRGPPAFTHISYDDFRVLRDGSGLFKQNEGPQYRTKASIKDREALVPYVLYTDPQLGHVGYHLHDIPESEREDIQVASMPMSYVARALETDEKRGIMKAVVNKKTGEILGFTCLGIEGGELMTVVQMAMKGKLKWWDLQDFVFAHPTIAESLNNLWAFLK
jgi:pyruvate/2-oxoglutarate dehydrogenase complex dihydrolipoamide dehydrogenase (E3) component